MKSFLPCTFYLFFSTFYCFFAASYQFPLAIEGSVSSADRDSPPAKSNDNKELHNLNMKTRDMAPEIKPFDTASFFSTNIHSVGLFPADPT